MGSVWTAMSIFVGQGRGAKEKYKRKDELEGQILGFLDLVGKKLTDELQRVGVPKAIKSVWR
jgi:hypothetical protein